MSFEYGTFFIRSNESYIVCPMPQRISYIPSCVLTKPREEVLRPWQSNSQFPVDSGISHEILDICVTKNARGDVSGVGFGRSPPYFSGSPPRRAGNPVVRDVKFCHQSPPHAAPIMAARAPPPHVPEAPAYRAGPCVRVEGFDCSANGLECTGRDTRCQVSASA